MPVLLPAGTDRILFMENMKACGIQTSIHYPPIHHFSAYQKIKISALPITDDVAEREVTLPLYPAMRDADVFLIAQTIQGVMALSLHQQSSQMATI